MKKYLLLFALFLFGISAANSQNFISISPSSGVRGTNISTTVTGAGFFFTMGSAPSTWGDFYMVQGSNTILPYNINILDNDHFIADWSIPANTPVGNYDVTWNQFGWNPISIPGGFNIGDVFISGIVFHDEDSSGIQNGTENPMYNQKILLLPDSSYCFTNTAGAYTFGTTGGNKDVKILSSPIWNNTTPVQVPLVVGSTNITGINFGLKGVIEFIDIDGSLTGGIMPRCNQNIPYYLNFNNTGTAPTHGEVKLIRSPYCTYISANVTPDNIAGNVYTWNYTNLLPGETRSIVVILGLPGAFTTFTNAIQVIARDDNGNIADVDEGLLTQTTLCAYDPNDKTVIPEGVQVPHYTLMSDTLDFVVRFQNTGNDTAFNVMILDTLNKNILDLNSFELIASSHPVVVDLRPSGIVEFIFDNILLPDSNINEPESHGFVRYRSRIKTGLPNNTVLNNTVHIYFDLNPAVVTNTTLNTLVYTIPVGLNETDILNSVTVMPNPVTEDAILTFSNSNNEILTLKVFDVKGKLIFEQMVNGEKATVPSKLLQKGVYIYELKNDSGSRNHTGKFVVM
ncbi:MAG TPA: T9SS type A sorting domain-containing protein [Bacteroidia bacterium]|nr:T9SS type A sorting domain-containing protein [Bacteroidia bacterium]